MNQTANKLINEYVKLEGSEQADFDKRYSYLQAMRALKNDMVKSLTPQTKRKMANAVLKR